MNEDTIVIVIQDGVTHTYRTNRKVNADINSLISDQKAGVDDMLADFQRDFSVEEQKQEEQKQKRGRKRLEPVSLREYDRHNYRLK
jgi:ferritin